MILSSAFKKCMLLGCASICLAVGLSMPLSDCWAAKPIARAPTTSKEVAVSAEQVLTKVARSYGACDLYMDSGFSTTTFKREDGSIRKLRYEFRTAFQRGEKFRFTYRRNAFARGYDEARVIWHDGKQTMVNWANPDRFEAEKSLGNAVAKFTGVSSGLSHTIPALLMPKSIGGVRIVELSAVKPPRKEVIKKKICWRIEGVSGGDKTVLWIDTASFLILKIEEHLDVEGERYLRTTSYLPVLNKQIPSALFKKEVEAERDSQANPTRSKIKNNRTQNR